MEKVLLFFSGGNDSTLSACRLVMQGYDVELITFDNGCEEGIENIRNRATVLEKLTQNSKKGKVHNLGVFQSVSEFMSMRQKTVNIPFNEIVKKYGNLNQNQLTCLSCRSAMYVVGIAVSKELGIKYIAEGARKTQMFAIEQKELLDGYRSVLERYDMDLMLPVFECESDYEVENELLRISYHFYDRVHDGTTHYEAKCWLGNPMDRTLTQEEIEGYSQLFECELEPRMVEDIDSYPSYPIREKLNNPVYTKIKFK